MALISGGIFVLMWILGHDFNSRYNWLALISTDIISGVYCILVLMWILGHDFNGHCNRLALISVDLISGVYCINELTGLKNCTEARNGE